MVFTLNPIDAIKFAVSNKQKRRQRAGEYLECIADEATKLANIWQEVVSEVMANGIYELPDETLKKHSMLWPKVQVCNAEQYSRLEEHFREVSSVLGEKYNGEMNSIVFHIGGLLNKRNITKELIDKELSSLTCKTIFDDNNSLDGFRNLQDSVDSLHREAAALHVRAKSFKAK